jgi:hypothetical protein
MSLRSSYRRVTLAVLTLLLALPALRAQEPQEEPTTGLAVRSIIDELTLIREGEGRVFIVQSPAIAALVHRRPSLITRGDLSDGYIYQSGYRVQVFSSNTPDARLTATRRAEEIRQAFPEMETDVLYKAPFWSVRMGNFLTRDQAKDFITQLKDEFPAFAREMYIVPSKIKVPL